MFPDFIADELNSSLVLYGSTTLWCKKCELMVDTIVDTLYGENKVEEKVFTCPLCREHILFCEEVIT